jgi:hypothetical protein
MGKSFPALLIRGRNERRGICIEKTGLNFCTFMTGSIASHALVSLVPVPLLALFLVSRVGDEALARAFIGAVAADLTPTGTAVDAEGDAEFRVTIGDREVTLPRPDEAPVTASIVDRPRIPGGDRERGAVRFKWDSRPRDADREEG